MQTGETSKQLQRLVVAPQQVNDGQIHLTTEQQHYLGRVLRLTTGDRFIAMDGQGQSWLCCLVDSGSALPRHATILEALTAHTELPIALTLIMALPKGSGFDDIVRQATELGVTCIAPVVSDRTLLHPSTQKLERWRRIAQEAAEQSERQRVPTILEPVPFLARLQHRLDTSEDSARYICVTRQVAPHLLNCLTQHLQPFVGSLAIAIGPEGGWTEAELNQAIAAGYQPVTLGARILRSVTAPLVALSLVAAACEGMGDRA